MDKPPTTRGISALLRKAGFERSVSSATRIRGWRSYSEGYTVIDNGGGEVRVSYSTGRFSSDDGAAKRAMLARYVEVICAKGWMVAGPDDMNRLTVTAKMEGGS